MKPLVIWMKRTRDSEKQETTWTKGLENLIEKFEQNWSQEVKSGGRGTNTRAPNIIRVVKPLKVPILTCDMSLETFMRQLNIWQTSNVDVPEAHSLRIGGILEDE